MFFVYVLKSKANGDLYIGYTGDLRRRFQEHNDGNGTFTKAYRPWVLIYYEGYRMKEDATRREVELKIHAAKNTLKQQLKSSLEI